MTIDKKSKCTFYTKIICACSECSICEHNPDKLKNEYETLEKALEELKSYISFSCMDSQAYDCMGDCSDCSYYAISKKDFKDACETIRKRYIEKE